MTATSIEVVEFGPVYRASTVVTLRSGSPYRSMFMHGSAKVVAWGASPESAARRCADKSRRLADKDEEAYRDRRSRTSHYDDQGRRLDR